MLSLQFPRFFLFLSVFSGVLLAAVSAGAAAYTWDGASSGADTAHWLPGPSGWPGAGHDMVINGGVVAVTDGNTAYRPQSVVINGGTLRFSGGGSFFNGSDATTRTITVNAGGILELDTWFKADGQSLGRLMPDAARLVLNGGTIRMNGVTGYGRGVTVNSAGAILETGPGADWLLHNLTDDIAWVYNGNPVLTFTGAGTGRFDKVISGSGGVIKRGPGSWMLSRTNTHTGPTIVEQGVLVLRRPSLADGAVVSIAAGGAVLSLRHFDRDAVGGLILGGVTMPPGTYNRNTHPVYFSGSGSLVVGGTAEAGTPSLGWYYGGGGDAAIQQQITDGMNYAVGMYNAYGYFHGNLRGEYNAGVPTAQAGFGGPVTFGASRSGRVAMHELAHVMGVGTHGAWGANLAGGVYTGAAGARLIQQIDGPGAQIHSDGTHFWPYGLNYDNESSARNDICSVRMVEAFAKDMGFFTGTSTVTAIGDRTIPVGAGSGTIPFTVGDPAVAAGSLVVKAAGSNAQLLPPGALVLGGSGAERTLQITPAAGVSGRAAVSVLVSGGRDAAVETFLLTVGSYTWKGGDGVWDVLAGNWTGAGTVWPAEGTNNDAVFAGSPGEVRVSGRVTVDDVTFNDSGFVVQGGPLNFVNTPSLAVPGGVTATVASPLEGAAALAKEGGGTLILSGRSAYAGDLYVNAGTLEVNGDCSGSQTVTVRDGAVLSGSGSLPDTWIENGGVLAPGPEFASLRSSSLTLRTGSRLVMKMDAVNSDHLAVNGDLALRGTLTLQFTGKPLNGYHTLIDYTGTLTGTLMPGPVTGGYTVTPDYSQPGRVRVLVTGGLDSASPVPAGSVWKYYAANPLPGTAWQRLDYADTYWLSGTAEIGYGDEDEATVISTAAGKPQVAYFRKSFDLTAEETGRMAGLILRLRRDDGAVVYLNGREIRRDNLPAFPAAVTPSTPASSGVTGTDESAWFTTQLDPSLLNHGPNVLAVEVHQDGPASSDLSFDLHLEALLGDADADADGLTDAWELTWFENLAAQTGDADADGDGVSNFTEMRARTSPVDAARPFVITAAATDAAGRMTFSWPSVTGVIYQVRRRGPDGPWVTLPGTFTGDGAILTFTDTAAMTGRAMYQVMIP